MNQRNSDSAVYQLCQPVQMPSLFLSFDFHLRQNGASNWNSSFTGLDELIALESTLLVVKSYPMRWKMCREKNGGGSNPSTSVY